MIRQIKSATLFVILLLFANTGCQNFTGHENLSWLDDYNIVWESRSQNSSESMPLGGGDIGCNVWVENGDLLFYIQRSGSLSESGEYLKLGRIRIKLSPNPFEDPSSFRQELILRDGYIQIESESGSERPPLKVKINLWVEVASPVIHVNINSDKPVEVAAAYESWRTEDRELSSADNGRERFGCFHLQGYPGEVIKRSDVIRQTDNGILFYHRNPENSLIPDVLIKQQGLENYRDSINDDISNRTFGGILSGKNFVAAGIDSGNYIITPYKSWIIKSQKPSRKHNLAISTHIGQTVTIDGWIARLNEMHCNVFKNQKSTFRNTVAWWHEFWDRSHIVINPGKPDPSDPVWQTGRNYHLFRYQLGCNAFGEYPSKFNGGNLTYDPSLVDGNYDFDPDWRAWGGDVFTAQNQRLLYWPMLKSGDFDAILPQFELYRKGLPGATARVKSHFGHKGAAYSEYTGVPGLELGAGWGWTDGPYRIRGEEVPFGDPRINGLGGYETLVEKGVMANPSISYHWESQVEHAYMILEYHRFTGNDISEYMPFIKAALIFFDEHYQLRQKMRNGKGLDENGKLVIYPSTSCESYRGAKNPTDIIAGLNACIESILNLNEKYVSSEEKEYFSGFLKRIPEYPFAQINGTSVINPAHEWLRESNQELPQFYPLFPFNRFKAGDKETEIFKNTYALAPAFRKGKIQSWHQDGIFFARMGMTKETADYNTRKLQDSERRFPTFWGPGHDWVPDHNHGGSGMTGLQEMLLQTTGDQIILFPAWPKEWDVSFKLHAPENTIVECNLTNGEVTRLKVQPGSRSKDIIISYKE